MLANNTTNDSELFSPIQPRRLLLWQLQGWSCRRCVWSWVGQPARWSTSWLWEQMQMRWSLCGRCCHRPFRTAVGSSVTSLYMKVQTRIHDYYWSFSAFNILMPTKYIIFFCEPGVTLSVARACSSCIMASLSSSLLRGIFIRSGFFADSSVSMHWKTQTHNSQRDYVFFLKEQIKIKGRISREADFLWRSVLWNRNIGENPGHRLFWDILRKKVTRWSVSKCMCLSVDRRECLRPTSSE